MKKFLLVIFCFYTFGCYSVDVKKEYPQKLNLDRYKTIQLGWIDFPAGLWRQFGYKNPGEWQRAVYDLNANVMKKYFKSALPGSRKILGPSRGNPRRGDLLIKFDYLGYNANFVGGSTAADRLNLRVEMYDVRRGRRIYSALLGLDSYRPGPGDWSVYRLEGRIAMEIRNLADFIGDKF